MGKLSARRVATVGPGKHEDGNGLRLVVSKTGARKWVLRITINGKRREMGLGAYPIVSLAEARDRSLDARRKSADGIDPIAARKQEAEKMPNFTQCAARYIRVHRRGWRNAKHARQWVSTLKTYARSIVGDKRVDSINTDDVLKILTPIWNNKTETAKRLQGRIENILDFAAARKWRDPTNPARWRGHLDKLLPRPSRVKTIVHHPAMPYNEVPAFVAELRQLNSVSALALQFLILTATRTSETLRAHWSEIDLEQRVWTLPASRMKAKREHRVPLSDTGLTILEALPRIKDNPYIFPGTRHGFPLSNMAMLQLMRGMGYGSGGHRGDYVPHGFRSSFRDWAGETTNFPRDVAEMALAHVIKDKAEAAYRRGDLFAKRRAMMDRWSTWCVEVRQGSPIVSFNDKRSPVESRS